jgi:Zn-dependent peptidase ImmA (M78 family)
MSRRAVTPIRLVRERAERLARQFDQTRAPIDAEAIAVALNVRVVYADLGADVSGLLVTRDSGATICVQKTDVPQRQRFTLAHELAHHVLRHHLRPGSHVHVDRGNYISQRGPRSAAGVDPAEIEANQFAASLLMPAALVRSHAQKMDRCLHDVDVVKLAETFEVSEQAMTIRLGTLKLL